MSLKNKLESLLFVATKPLSLGKIAELTGAAEAEVKAALEELKKEFNDSKRGIQLVTHHTKAQLMTSPESRSVVEAYLRDEQFGELTKPSLETLTIVTYRGPITKPELEQIRGVNCSLILRNLMIKGLVEANEDKERMQTVYTTTFDFIRYLGIREVNELPDYDKLSHHETLEKVLTLNQEKPEEENA
ncbi:MAG: SMC-Scp complex subunit ScpB [Patescibacteria group bacterium]|nr:SMC-Scp complex subunit ScpB [Patescibacteria group bacterium]